MIKKELTIMAIALACLAALSAVAQGGATGSPIPWKTEEYTLVAREMPLREVLMAFGTAEGLPVVLSSGVVGVVSGDFRELPPPEFLDRLAALHSLTWFYDGAALYVYNAGEVVTALFDLKYMKVQEVQAMLSSLGIDDGRYPLKAAADEQLAMVAGPPRYVELVAELVAKADQLREKRAVSEVETRVFPLQHTWADDVILKGSGGDGGGQIKGMVSLLEEIMVDKNMVQIKERMSSDKEDGGKEDEEDFFSVDRSIKPVIKAENRLNAVIVRDLVSRMPLYEKLIAELDVPQKLVEIAVTTLEMSREDALDWQLSLAVRGQHDRVEGAAGQNAANLFSAADLAGKGLAGALTYLGENVSVSASLSALRQKGKMRSISRTSILTVNNMGASLSDMQSYHARVVGAEVAALESVSAGTSLEVKPRIVKPEGPGRPNSLWMTITLADGGFESVSVDSMPVTRSSSLTTQTSVNEGECLLLAGYLRDIEEKAGWGIPFLRDIPFIGWLFGGVSKKKQNLQRMFILTPYIVELDTEDLARVQATRQRDIHREEELEDDKLEDDALREVRDLERQERDRAIQEKYEDLLERRKAELEFERTRREAEREERRREWQEELDAAHEEFLEDRQALEKEKAGDRGGARRRGGSDHAPGGGRK